MTNKDNSKFLEGLEDLKMSLSNDVLQLRLIQKQIEQLNKFNDREEMEYLENLLHPETRPGVKIPSRIPIPSVTFQLRSATIITTNNDGNAVFRVNPWVLADESIVGKTYTVATDMTGSTQEFWAYVCPPISSMAVCNYDDFDDLPEGQSVFKTVNMDQIVPSGLYSSFRVVSASLRIRYIGTIEKASGFMGGGISNKAILGTAMRYYTISKTTSPSPLPYDPNHSTYNSFMYGGEFLDINNINNLVYSYQGNCLDGVRLLYFPVDNKYEEFTKLFSDGVTVYPQQFSDGYQNAAVEPKDTRNSFWWLAYAQGLPPDSSCLRAELTINYECMPAEKLLNYMPVSINPIYIDPKIRKKLLEEIAKKSVSKNKNYE